MFWQKIADFCLCRSSPNQFQHQAHTWTCTNLLIHFYLKATIQLSENCKISILQPSDTLYMYLYANFFSGGCQTYILEPSDFLHEKDGLPYKTNQLNNIVFSGWNRMIVYYWIYRITFNKWTFSLLKSDKSYTSPSYDDIWRFTFLFIWFCIVCMLSKQEIVVQFYLSAELERA